MGNKKTQETDRIKSAYSKSKNIYDDTLTRSKWWSRLYIDFFWGGVDDTVLADKVLSFIPDNFKGRLLDVPVGTGVFTLDKYKRLSRADITCLDYSPDMLAGATRRFQNAGLKNIRFIKGDVGSLDFEDETFDAVLSMNGFHAFPDKDKAFSQTARVLKKGGVFCGCFYIKGGLKRSDFIVNKFLAKKGWFSPPFQTFEELKVKLSSLYSSVELWRQKSMVYFKCVK